MTYAIITSLFAVLSSTFDFVSECWIEVRRSLRHPYHSLTVCQPLGFSVTSQEPIKSKIQPEPHDILHRITHYNAKRTPNNGCRLDFPVLFGIKDGKLDEFSIKKPMQVLQLGNIV